MRVTFFDIMDDTIEAYERKGMSHCKAVMAARKQLDENYHILPKSEWGEELEDFVDKALLYKLTGTRFKKSKEERKSFNLDDFNTGNYDLTTRDGRKVTSLRIDDLYLKGLIELKDSYHMVLKWFRDGKCIYYRYENSECENDLFLVKKEQHK